jgi:ADP-dependent NAD(P)H-hydrate dehydratase / NAD(P)H-hydrate epimerase
MYILSRKEMKKVDEVTIKEFGLSGTILMELAGKACFDFIRKMLQPEDEIALFCGTGNNGGDGFVMARWLHSNHYKPTVFLGGKIEKMSPETGHNYMLVKKLGMPVHILKKEEDWNQLRPMFPQDKQSRFKIIVDAYFGIGFRGVLPKPVAKVAKELNETKSIKVTIDIPSGVDADNGKVEDAFIADYTLTMAAPKYGHYLGKGRDFCGEVTSIDIGIPLTVWDKNQPLVELACADNIKYPTRKIAAHKGDYGRVAIIAGSPGFSGAAIMAAQAALKSGAGLVKLFHPQGMEDIFETQLTEVMTQPFPFTENTRCIKDSYIAEELCLESPIEDFVRELKKNDVLLIGPGLGMNRLAVALVNFVTTAWNKPVIFDADALNILAKYPQWLDNVKSEQVLLTPHIGEFSRLIPKSISDIEQDPVKLALAFSKKYRCNLLLKSSYRLFAGHEGYVLDVSGNDGLSTGGSGDVLSGIIVSFLAQKQSVKEASVAASYLLGTTAERLTAVKRTPAITPTDVIDNLFRV